MGAGIAIALILPGACSRHATAAARAVAIVAAVVAAVGTGTHAGAQSSCSVPPAPEAPLVGPPAVIQIPIAPQGEPLTALSFSPDGKRLATASAMLSQSSASVRVVAPFQALLGPIKIWDVSSARMVLAFPNTDAVKALAFSPDGNMLVTGALTGELRLMDANTGKELARVHALDGWVNDVAFSTDGSMVASAGQDGMVKLWDVPGLQQRKVLQGHANGVTCAAFFHHGPGLVSGSDDKTARVWNVQTGATTISLGEHPQRISAVAMSPDDRLVATASGDNTIRLWGAATGKEQGELHGRDNSLVAVAFSPDGKLLAGGTRNGPILLWEAKSRNLVGALEKHAAIVQAVAFSPDSTRLASASGDATVRIWDVVTRKAIATLLNPWTAYVAGPQGEAAPAKEPPRQQVLRELRVLERARLRDREMAQLQLQAHNAIAQNESSKSSSKWWTLSALAAGLLLSYLLFWLYVRWSRRKGDNVSSDGEVTPCGPSAPVTLACASCGKRLRARADLAGKRVKWPACGQSAIVPGESVETAVRPAVG
jgi:WD domain, G-beta repeat